MLRFMALFRNYLDFCKDQWKKTMQTRKANNLGKVTRAEFVDYVRKFAAEYQIMKQEVDAIKKLSSKEEADIKMSYGQQLAVSKEEFEHPETNQLQAETEVPKVAESEVSSEDVSANPHIIVVESASVDQEINSIVTSSSADYSERIVLSLNRMNLSRIFEILTVDKSIRMSSRIKVCYL